MTTRQKIGALTAVFLFFIAYLYIDNQSTKFATDDYTFPPPAEDAPLTQRELDIQKGLIPNEPIEIPEDSYADGIYRSNAMYLIPNEGQFTLAVTMSLKDERVSGVSIRISPETTNPEADSFVRSYRSEVLNKKIAELELEAVDNAPLTTNAFNNSLRDIRKQALK